jgi:hypothetical protein
MGSSESFRRTTGCRVRDSWLNLKAIVLAAFLRQGYSTTSPHPQVHTRVHWDIISTSMRTVVNAIFPLNLTRGGLERKNFHHLGAFKISCTQQMQQRRCGGEEGWMLAAFSLPFIPRSTFCLCRVIWPRIHPNMSADGCHASHTTSPARIYYRRRRYLKENIIPQKSVWSGRLSSRIQPAARHTYHP